MQEAEQVSTNKWVILSQRSLYMMGAVERGSWPILLPSIQDDLGLSTEATAWILVVFALGTAGSALTVGRLGDLFGYKKLAGAGIFLDGGLMVVAALMPSLWPLLLVRFLQGVGAATGLNNLQAATIRSFPLEERGRVLGILNAGTALCVMLAPAYAGLMNELFNWRVALIGLSPFFFANSLMIFLLFKPDARQPSTASRSALRALDWPGAALLLASFAAMILGARFLISHDHRPLGALLLLLSIAGFVLTVRFERRSAAPILDLQIFSNIRFSAASFALIWFNVMQGAVSFLFPFYLQRGLHWGTAYAGRVQMFGNASQPIASPIGGWLTDRVGPRRFQPVGVLITLAGLLVATQLGASVSVWQVVLALILIGLGGSLFNPANNRIIYDEAPQQSLGSASAVAAAGRYTGNSLGAALGAGLLALGGADVAGAFGPALLVLALLFFAGMSAILVTLSIIDTASKRHRPVEATSAPVDAAEVGRRL